MPSNIRPITPKEEANIDAITIKDFSVAIGNAISCADTAARNDSDPDAYRQRLTTELVASACRNILDRRAVGKNIATPEGPNIHSLDTFGTGGPYGP